MGFWGGLLKVAKVAAPIALAATGVGIPAAMAVNAGLSAAEKKVNGGSWKSALGAGALGAATSAVPVGGAAVNTGIKSGLANAGKSLLTQQGLSTIGEIASGVAASRAAGRKEAADLTGSRDLQRLQAERIYQDALRDRADVDIKQRELTRDARGTDARDAIFGALVKNMSDVSLSRPSSKFKFEGGARPSAIGEEGRQAGETLNQKALAALIQGEQFSPMEAPSRMALGDLPKAGVFDKILGGVGMAGLAGGALRAIPQGPSPYMPPSPGLGNGLPNAVPGTAMAMPQAPTLAAQFLAAKQAQNLR